VNDKGRSRQQSQDRFLRAIEFRADTAHPLRASEISDILKAIAAGKIRKLPSLAKVAIASFIIGYRDEGATPGEY
jgi:hypothetical protein